MKRKLLLAALCVVGALGFKAQAQDMTSRITNPTFTSNSDGWQIEGPARYYTNGKGFDGTASFIELTDWNNSWDATISQEVSDLDNGYYKVRAAGQMSGNSDCWMKLVANGAESYFSRNGDTGGNILANGTETTIGSGVAGWRYTSVIAKVTDGTLTISCVGHSDSNARWANFDHVTLEFLGTEIAANTDVTEYINNWDFWGCFNGNFNGWTIYAPNGGNTWKNGDSNVEYWIGTASNGVFDYYQNVSGLTPGKYTLSASMWNSTNGEAGATFNTNTGVYGTSDGKTVFAGVTTDSDTPATYTTDGIVVANGQLRVGVKNNDTMGARWFGVDWIKLTYIGKVIGCEAIALPAGDMTAGSWYYFDIDIDGTYNLTLTELDDIVYTTDGAILMADESTVTTKFSGTSAIQLNAGRYYVKSSSPQTLSVAADTKTYSLGSVTAQSIAEGEYIKNLTTLVLTYGSAATNDEDASLALIGTPVATLRKGGSTVATGVLSANVTEKTLTATFSDVDLEINSTDYSIIVPAGAFGYEGESVNEEVTINFNTPLFADGDYYLKNKSTGAYFAGGNYWGTQAVTNNIGHIVNLTALSDGKYTINTYLYNGGTSSGSHFLNGLWCDGAATGWSFTADGDYYVIGSGTDNLTAGEVGATMTLANGTGDNTKWTLLTAAQWKAEQVARLDDATANNGVDATFYIAAPNFNRNDDLENAKWNGEPFIDGLAGGDVVSNYNGQKYNTTPFDVYQVITGMKPGVYKVTMDGFYRNGTTDDRNAFLYANDFSVALVNIRSANVTEQDDDKGFTTANGDFFVPNKQDQAAKAFDNNYYNNELEFTVGQDGELRIGVKKTVGANLDWAVFDNFQLTYYGTLDYTALQTAYDNKIGTVPTNLGFEAGDYAPYVNAANLQAFAIAKDMLDNENALTQTAIDNAKTAIEAEMTWTANTEDVDAIYNGLFAIVAAGQNYPDGWTRTNNWGQMQSGLEGTYATAYYNQPGSLQYGNQGVYTMPLAANTWYKLTFAYRSQQNGSNNWVKVSVLKGEDGLAATQYPKNESDTEWKVVEKCFLTGAAGDYVLTLNNDGNTIMTGVSLVKLTATTKTSSANLQGYKTFYDADVDYQVDANTTIYKATSKNDESVTITAVDGKVIPAGTPVIVKTSNTEDYIITFTPTTSGTEDSFTDNILAAATGNGTETNKYILGYLSGEGNGLGFYMYEPSLDAGDVYLNVSNAANVRLGIITDGEATAINSVKAEAGKANEATYNMAGQRVNGSYKGIVIKNGKKYMIK